MASSGFPSPKKFNLFTYPGTSHLPDIPIKETRTNCPIIKDRFLEAIDRLPFSAWAAFEDVEADEDHYYITLFDDHPARGRDAGPLFNSVDDDREGRNSVDDDREGEMLL